MAHTLDYCEEEPFVHIHARVNAGLLVEGTRGTLHTRKGLVVDEGRNRSATRAAGAAEPQWASGTLSEGDRPCTGHPGCWQGLEINYLSAKVPICLLSIKFHL